MPVETDSPSPARLGTRSQKKDVRWRLVGMTEGWNAGTRVTVSGMAGAAMRMVAAAVLDIFVVVGLVLLAVERYACDAVAKVRLFGASIG